MKICFGPFLLDLDTRQLTRGAEALHLSPKAFDLLATLALERPKAISKAALQQRLWPATFVAEANLSNLIAEVRETLDDCAREPRYIRTVHRYGYAFSGDASAAGERGDAAIGKPVCWIQWGAQRIPLGRGEHVIGRDADAEIRIDASTVSRRHARIVVDGSGARLEDFDSKNGTFRRGVRVSTPVPLADGDDIRIGSQSITYHVNDTASTETQVEPPS